MDKTIRNSVPPHTSYESETQKRLFDFAYRIALDDAVRQSAYNGKGRGSKTRLRECSSAKEAVKRYIDDSLNGIGPNFYDAEKSVEISFAEFNTEEWHGTFTFGNAQKLINMTAKYILMMAYENEAKANLFRHSHCPMDKQSICKVAELIGKLVQANELTDAKAEKMLAGFAEWKPRKKTWSIKDDFSWSKMASTNKEPYERFQKTVRFLGSNDCALTYLKAPKALSALEFDYYIWP